MKAKDVMTRGVISVAPNTPLRDVAAILAEKNISGVPVVVEGRCVGVVSEADLLPKQIGRPISSRSALDGILGERSDPEELRRRAATTAEEAMSRPPVTIDEDRPLREAALIMVDRDVNRLPVVSNGLLVGILTRHDLVKAYLRLDSEIRHAVRDDVLRRTMWLDPEAFDLEVREGIVRIAGTVDRRSTARIVERLIGLVDGVVGVRSGIRWELDDTELQPAPEVEHEPGSASILDRERHAPMHR